MEAWTIEVGGMRAKVVRDDDGRYWVNDFEKMDFPHAEEWTTPNVVKGADLIGAELEAWLMNPSMR